MMIQRVIAGDNMSHFSPLRILSSTSLLVQTLYLVGTVIVKMGRSLTSVFLPLTSFRDTAASIAAAVAAPPRSALFRMPWSQGMVTC